MYRHRIRPPGGNRLALTGHAGVGGGVGTLFTKALTGMSALAARGRMAISQSGFGYVTTAPPPTSWNVTPAPTLTAGSGGTYDIAWTGPVNLGYAPGGLFDVSSTGNPLPVGMSLSAAGSLSVGSATPGVSPGIVFGYNEPNALPVLTLHSGATAGQLPYMAAVYPAEGTVPSGMTIVSTEDSSLRASVLSRWPDNSAQVVVVAGHKTGIVANSTTTVTCRAGIQTDTVLTTAAIASKFTTGIVFTNFGGGTQTLNSWGSPDRTWWANSQVICARYRQSLGVGAMEAVIDVHAFAGGSALVEVVIENSRINVASPTAPAAQSYTGATVAVNGTTIATVNSSHTVYYYHGDPINAYQSTTEANHPAFRAWYCSAKVESGVVTALTTSAQYAAPFGVQVTHDTASMQAHPWFWKQQVAVTADMQTRWNGSAYTPWGTGDYPAYNMGGTGGQAWIGVLSKWEADYLCTGNKYAAQASIVNAYALLSYDYNERNQSNNLVVSAADIGSRNIGYSSNWPSEPARTVSGNTAPAEPAFEEAHEPPCPMLAFMCRPSPVIIEVAQKVFAWNVFRWGARRQYSQVRGRAWRFRNLGHAIWLTPDSSDFTTWKSSARALLADNTQDISAYQNSANNKLDFVWNGTVGAYENDMGSRVKGQEYLWQFHWLTRVLHHIDKSKTLRGTDGTAWTAIADWAAKMQARYINEPTNGEWRALDVYGDDVSSTDPPTMTQPTTYAGIWTINMTGTPPAASGPLLSRPSSTTYAWSAMNTTNATLGDNYQSYFWAGLCTSVERDVSGAATAWAKFNANVTNISTFLGAADDGRNNMRPRNV